MHIKRQRDEDGVAAVDGLILLLGKNKLGKSKPGDSSRIVYDSL